MTTSNKPNRQSKRSEGYTKLPPHALPAGNTTVALESSIKWRDLYKRIGEPSRRSMISGSLGDILHDIFSNGNIRPVTIINNYCPFEKDICAHLVRIKAACYVDEDGNDCAKVTHSIRIFDGLRIDRTFSLSIDNQPNKNTPPTINVTSSLKETKDNKDYPSNLYYQETNNLSYQKTNIGSVSPPADDASEKTAPNKEMTCEEASNEFRKALYDDMKYEKRHVVSELSKGEETYLHTLYAHIKKINPSLPDAAYENKEQGIRYIKSFREKYLVHLDKLEQVKGISNANSYTEAIKALWEYSNGKKKEKDPNVDETPCPFLVNNRQQETS